MAAAIDRRNHSHGFPTRNGAASHQTVIRPRPLQLSARTISTSSLSSRATAALSARFDGTRNTGTCRARPSVRALRIRMSIIP
jgi:hypothetical protein